MEIRDWDTTKELSEIYRDVRKLGLEQNIAEHDAFGFTVVPPEKVGPPAFSQRLLEAILTYHERRTGQHIGLEDLGTASLEGDKPIEIHLGLIGEDPIFEEALNNPAVLALARYFCGRSVLLSDAIAIMKRRDDTPSHLLHIDQAGAAPPLPPFPQLLNITWPLTTYTRENGPIAIVPGSHRFGRLPQPYETDFLRPDAPVKGAPIECEPGSLIVFGGTTWHAAFPRTAPGLRVTFVMTFCRPFMKQMRDFRNISREILARNPPEFARLLGADALFPMNRDDPGTPEQFESFRAAGRNPWG
jgi:hypothetical protein